MSHSKSSDVVSIEAFSSSLSLAGALQKGLISLGEDFPAQGVFSNIYYPDKREVRFLAAATRTDARELFDIVHVPQEIDATRRPRSGDIYHADALADDPFTAFVAPHLVPKIQSYVMVPVQLEGRHLGVVCFWSEQPRAFAMQHRKALERLKMLLSLNVGFALGRRLASRTYSLEAENKALTESLERVKDAPLTRLIRNTPSMKTLEPVIRQAASFDVPVLITGESGTGKEVIAQCIHRMSSRSMMPFVRVNCSAIPDSLIESELFGYEAGAFTDAKRRRIGLFEEADGGTIFLDEIGELPLPMQAKILHAVQDQKIRRVGASNEIRIDVRIISATNRNLPEQIEQRRFRLDLFYRLNVLDIKIKPLRERQEDFPTLLELFTKEVEQRFDVKVPENFAQNLVQQAHCQLWPGNVRELRNTVIRSVLAWTQNQGEAKLLVDEKESIPVSTRVVHQEIEPETESVNQNPMQQTDFKGADGTWLDFEGLQKAYFKALMTFCEGKISGVGGVAQIAGLHPNTLRSRLAKLHLL